MEIIRVGILHKEEKYAKALAKGLSRESRSMSFCILGNDAETAECSLVLTDSESSANNVICLAENFHDERITEDPPYRLFRYKNSRDVVNDLLFIYFKITGRTAELKGSGNTRLLTVLSQCGGAGATMLSLSLCIMLNRIYGSRCLYINLCPINDAYKYINEGARKSMLKLLYYLRQKGEFPIGTFISSHDELDTVDTDIINPYFDDVKPELMGRLMEMIEKTERHDFIVVDIGNHLSRQNSSIAASSNCLIRVSIYDKDSKNSYYKEERKQIDTVAGVINVIHVLNFAGDMWSGEGDESVVISAIEDPMEESIDQIKKHLNNNFGVEVAELARRVTEGCKDESV